MMIQIYLSGGMSGMSVEDQTEFRDYIQDSIYDSVNDMLYTTDKVRVFNPYNYYNYQVKAHDTEKEIMNYELNNIRNSSVVIVDFVNPKSLGTMAEMAIAYEHRIPIIGYNPYEHELHPWQIEMTDKMFKDIEELIEYVEDYYILGG